MGRKIHYQRMKGSYLGPEVCPVHKLLYATESEAKAGAQKIRAESQPGSPGSLAQGKICPDTRSWHIYIPTQQRARTLRQRGIRNQEEGSET